MNQNSIYKLCLGIDEKKELGFPDSSKRKRNKINESVNKILGLDCEMVLLHDGNHQIVSLTICELKLTNEDLTNEDGSTGKNGHIKTLLDVSFKPNPHTVKDYITSITGFSKDSKYTFEYSHWLVQQLFRKYIRSSDILCGHHLIGDLKLIDIYPKWIIDTCMLFHHPDGPPHFYSLQTLAKTYLHIEIQKGAHTSLEDTQTALQLVWYFYKNGYLKPQWHSIHECFNDQLEKSPVKTTMSIVQKLLSGNVNAGSTTNPIQHKIQAIYLRGSRAIGTHKPESDWDIIVILEDSIPVTDNALIKYGNVDIVLFNQSGWIAAMKKYIIYVLECIFGLTWLDTIGFKQLFLDHQTSIPKEMRFPYLLANVGLEFNKKIGSAKRALANGLIHRAKKSLFIAYRFACYGAALVEHGKIENIRDFNSFWNEVDDVSGEDFKRDFSKWVYKCKVPYKRFKGLTPKLKRHGGFREGENGDHGRDLAKLRKSNLKLGFDISSLSLDAFINLLKNKTRDEIETICMSNPLKLIVKFHSDPKYPLVQLRYSPMSPITKLTNQLRGAIIDYKTGELVAMPFYRFFDYGDTEHAAQIDWKSAKIQKKMDGSLAIMYFYQEKWHVATSRTPDGSSIMGKIRGRSNESGFVFRDKFWKLLGEQFSNTEWDTTCCYMFEMMTPEHIIICRYPTDKLTLLGVRDMRTLGEIHLEENDLEMEENHRELNLEQLVEKVSNLDAMCEEGYVVVDQEFNRIKIKSKEYVRMQWLYPLCGTVKKIDDKRLLITIRQESQKDLLLYCPELKPRLNELEKKLDSLCKTIDGTYQSIFADGFHNDHRPILKREFAKVVKQLKVDRMVKSGLFKLYQGIKPKAFLASVPLKKLSKYIS